jgi:hypothetical protein
MTRRSLKTLILGLAAACLLAAAPLHARGPATQEERDKALKLVQVTETEPWSDAAKDARTWLTKWLGEVPDITAKTCPGLIGPPEIRKGVPEYLMQQILFSGLGFLIQNPSKGAGETPTLVAALEGTLRTYQKAREHGSQAVVPQMEELLKIQKAGNLSFFVRDQARTCI